MLVAPASPNAGRGSWLSCSACFTASGLPEHCVKGACPRTRSRLLLFFNLGVELGQLAFIAAVFAVVMLVRRAPVTLPTWAWRIPVYGIGSIAMYWTIERVVGFWW